jgi:hypothetical protein
MGGVPEILVAGLERETRPMCTTWPSRFCLLENQTPRAQIERAFDPSERVVRELFRLPIQPGELVNTAISPDGRHIAAVTKQFASGHIRLYSIDGTLEKDLDIQPWTSLFGVDFAHDSKSLFVPSVSNSGVSLVHVELTGRTDLLFFNAGAQHPGYGIPSPDGRHIAIRGSTVDRNVWVVQDP